MHLNLSLSCYVYLSGTLNFFGVGLFCYANTPMIRFIFLKKWKQFLFLCSKEVIRENASKRRETVGIKMQGNTRL